MAGTGPQLVVAKSSSISVTVNNAAAAYAANDLVGTKLTVSNIARGNNKQVTIQTIAVTCRDDIVPDVDIFLFPTDPSGTTFTDNSPLGIDVSNINHVRGPLRIAAGDWKTTGASGMRVATKMGLGWAITAVNGNLYAAYVTRTAITFTNGSTVQIHFESYQD
jgi:hypothetical protein